MTVINKYLLLETHLFKSLDSQQLDRVISATRKIKLSDGETLFNHGDQVNHYYLVIEGNIKLFRISEGGNEKIIQIVKSREFFAEAAMFMEQSHYPINAAAVSDSVLYQFESKIYLDLLSESRELCFALFGDLSIRLHGLLNEIERLSLQNGRYRVVQYLENQIQDNDSETIVLTIEKRTIALMLSITPETLSRLFRELVDADVVSISGKTIQILDRQLLRSFGRS